MRKEIKNLDKIVGIVLIILTAISLVINALQFTHGIYNCIYDTTKLNSLLISTPFGVVLWLDNILVYLFGLLYILSAIDTKKDMLLKISFSIFSIVTTMISSTLIINFVATIFGLF